MSKPDVLRDMEQVMIAIIDYDAGNIRSVEKALLFLGEDAVITSDRETILKSDAAILPGVGAFGDAMKRLTDRGIDKVIYEFVETGKPFLGICLGLQLLFRESEESPGVPGLGLLDGAIHKIPSQNDAGETFKVPQIGWNDIDINPESKLFQGIEGKPYVYFVHSFYLKADNPKEVAATTEYSLLQKE